MRMRTATRHARTVTVHATRPRLTVLSSVSTGILWPPVRTAAALVSPPGPRWILANSAKTGLLHGFPPETPQEWARARFREDVGCPQTVLASLFPTKGEGGASDQI